MATQNPLKTASVLAFERKLDPSDALLFSGSWNDRDSATGWAPVPVREKSVRGTISNRLKTKDQDPVKLDASIENPNLQTVEVAALPAASDTLKVCFTLRVLSVAGTPNACNNADYLAKLLATVRGYVDSVGFGELASRYAWNLANGRFLWRNRVGAEQVEVLVQHMVNGLAQKSWTFDGLALSLRNFEAGASAAPLKELGDVIAAGLGGQSHVLLQVTAFARLGAGQEVYPSQELILDKGSSGKSKTLYKVGDVAGMHSQKLGNALRTIDTWHREVDVVGPIAVEPYGSITTLGKACRRPGDKEDFYSLLDNWLLKDRVPELKHQHFVMATLIRGGVFGDAGKD
ncbi:type I-F CRISPR-associated protein Csy3 [Amphibiibacter pelophylacis]|uniref:Type I-F CRISPR-associated protein Csy3 n=1 Tax=Amphibiibacter pelophylacis TaxID=1799477 RepID=A0ACC6P291_9BURK